MANCKRHPQVETELRCSRCEDYICPKCAVLTPVGYRCRTCGLERSATRTLAPFQLAFGTLLGFALGFITAYLMPAIFGLFMFFIGAIVGGFIGRLVSQAINRKSSNLVGAVTALGFLVGAIANPLRAIVHGQAQSSDALSLIFSNPGTLIFAAVAAATSWVQLK